MMATKYRMSLKTILRFMTMQNDLSQLSANYTELSGTQSKSAIRRRLAMNLPALVKILTPGPGLPDENGSNLLNNGLLSPFVWRWHGLR